MNFQENVLLKNYSNYKIGGPAKFFIEVSSVEELKEALKTAKSRGISKIVILGGGTKVLINDEGIDGLVIYNKIVGIKREGNDLKVGSGVLTKDFLNYCIENSLSGLEWAGGLPGTVGGAVRGNAGSFGGEIKDSVIKVESLDLKTSDKRVRDNEKCQFEYRNSLFKVKDNSEFISWITLRLKSGNKEKIRQEIQEKIDYRNDRQPLEYPSIGSTFKNIPLSSLSKDLQEEFSAIAKNDPLPVILVTKILALCGLKGKRVGGAMISDKHPNFILNINNATAKDVKALIEIAKQAVKKKYNLSLKEEIIYLN